jgi:RecG-like helicase
MSAYRGTMASQRRQIAYKVRVVDVLNGEFVRKDGWEPNTVVIGDGKEVSRVNLIATVVTQPTQEANFVSVVLDDGTGKIPARSFDSDSPVNSVEIGTVALVIGRIREYNQERYLVPEIMKKIDNPAWIKMRQLELKGIVTTKPPEPVEEKVEVPGPSDKLTDIPKLIKELDKGDGADIQEVVNKMDSPSAEEIIADLLRQGEIFEIRPGRLKVLD